MLDMRHGQMKERLRVKKEVDQMRIEAKVCVCVRARAIGCLCSAFGHTQSQIA